MKGNTCVRLFADHVQLDSCKVKISKAGKALESLSDILSLAGNEVRLKIVYLLEEESELCPCDLAEILEMSNPAISQHLKKLKEGKIVKTRKVGQTIYYSLKDENLQILQPFFKHITEHTKRTVIA